MNFRYSNLLFSLIFTLLVVSCARRGRPTGGEIDKEAPIMIIATPDHETTNFDSEKIRINFNEYIKLKDINKQLVISPPMENAPIITPVGSASKFINIKILDTLKENTTYTFNFGNSIEDNNEGNPLEQFKYVFSTGNYIDSLRVSGTVADGFNKNPDEGLSILLYEVNETYKDSIIYKERPSYVANTLDSIGYELTNLKSGKYLLIALNDFNNNKKFDPKIDKIGFIPSFINLPTDSTYNLTLFKEVVPYKLMRPSEEKIGHLFFGYEGIVNGINIEPLSTIPDDFKSSIVYEKDMDSISYWHTPVELDSLLFKVSLKNKIDTVSVKLRSKERDSLIVNNGLSGQFSLKDTFVIKTNIPIYKIDKSKISLIDKDSTKVNFTTILDESKMKLRLNFEKKYNNRYNFTFLPEAIEDLFGDVNDTLNFNVSTKHPDDYGIINISLTNVESFPIIVDLINESYEIIDRVYATENQVFKFENLTPSNYSIRVIYDKNNNRQWDTGNFLNRVQPEKVKYYNRLIEIRANWEENQTFDLK